MVGTDHTTQVTTITGMGTTAVEGDITIIRLQVPLIEGDQTLEAL